MEERRKVAIETTQNIEEVEALCAIAVKQVSQSWESLIDDTEVEQVIEKMHAVEADFNELMYKLMNLLIVEKMSKVADMNKLQ